MKPGIIKVWHSNKTKYVNSQGLRPRACENKRARNVSGRSCHNNGVMTRISEQAFQNKCIKTSVIENYACQRTTVSRRACQDQRVRTSVSGQACQDERAKTNVSRRTCQDERVRLACQDKCCRTTVSKRTRQNKRAKTSLSKRSCQDGRFKTSCSRRACQAYQNE